MTFPNLSRLTVAWLAVRVLATAAPLPKPQVKPISPKNVAELVAVEETKRDVDRILPGSKKDELILLDWSKSAEVVDHETLKPLRKIAEGQKPIDLAVSPDGKYRLWHAHQSSAYTLEHVATGKTTSIEIGDSPGDGVFSPDSKTLVIGHTYWNPKAEGVGQSSIRFFGLDGKFQRTIRTPGPGAVHPLYSPDGKILAVGNRNYETVLFDAKTLKRLHTLEKRMTQEIAFSPDSQTLAAGFVDGTLSLYDVATGKLLHSMPSGCEEVYSVAWNPKGDLLATSGRSGKVAIWSPTNLKKLKELDAGVWVIRVRFIADGTRLLTTGSADPYAQDRKFMVWRIPKN